MIRISLLSLAMALAVLGGVPLARLAALSWPHAALVVTALLLVVWGCGAMACEFARRRRLARDGRRGRLIRGLAAAATVARVARGGAGFSASTGDLLALERGVLLLPAAGSLRLAARERFEQAVRDDLASATPQACVAIARGLRDAADAAVAALGAPLHPLHPRAAWLLATLGLRARLRRFRRHQRASWARRRRALDPLRPAEALAVRLLAAGLERAALTALATAGNGVRARRLRRLARCRTLLLDAARGRLFALAPEADVSWREELLMLAGRRLPELVPGSPFLRGVPGAAAALERIAARTPVFVAELVALLEDGPELERPVATVVARVVGWPAGAVLDAIRDGTLAARPDNALRAHLRGLALLDERRLAEAGGEFEAALVRAPDFAQAAFALATTRRRLGRVAAGEAVLRALVERRPREPEPALFLARYVALVGERERARREYEAAVERFPGCVPLRLAFAQELLEWGRGADASEQLAAARRDAPGEPRLALLAGRVLAAEFRLDEAAEALELAARGLHGGGRGEAWFWLMNVRRDQGDHATAERIARRLVHALGARQSSLLDDVAEYLEERRDYVRAREAAERARHLRERDEGA